MPETTQPPPTLIGPTNVNSPRTIRPGAGEPASVARRDRETPELGAAEPEAAAWDGPVWDTNAARWGD